jgi:hypothetical protein
MRPKETGPVADAPPAVAPHQAAPRVHTFAETSTHPLDCVSGSGGDYMDASSPWAAAWIDLGGEG